MSTALLIAHVWIGAAWFGGVWLSLVNLHRRGPALFDDPAEFERVIAGFTRGNRWIIIGAASGVAVTGALAWSLIDAPSPTWTALMYAKLGLLVGNVAIMSYVSWVIWPRRLFALPEELGPIRRRQAALRVASLVFLAVSVALGVAAHALRSRP